MIIWFGDEELPHRSLIKAVVCFVAKKEHLTFSIVYTDDEQVVGPFSQSAKGTSKRPVIFIPHGGSMKEKYQGKDGLVTSARMHTSIIKRSDIPKEMKEFLVILVDILHEMGHIKFHLNRHTGRSTLDKERYYSDLDYRLDTENEAEQLATEWFKHFGFYKFVNDISGF